MTIEEQKTDTLRLNNTLQEVIIERDGYLKTYKKHNKKQVQPVKFDVLNINRRHVFYILFNVMGNSQHIIQGLKVGISEDSFDTGLQQYRTNNAMTEVLFIMVQRS